MSRTLALFLWLGTLTAAAPGPVIHTNSEAALRKALARGTGIIELPHGGTELHRSLEIPSGAKDLEIRGNPGGSLLSMSRDFLGPAVLVAANASGLTLSNFEIRGNREWLRSGLGLPPGEVPFADFYSDNAILIRKCAQVRIRAIFLLRIPGFAVLVNASSGVTIDGLTIEDSGTLNSQERNNTTGGILIEEGASEFTVRNCKIRRVLGNGIWTHSYQASPRNRNGQITGNFISTVARDAIQVGHATGVRVDHNNGEQIGFPASYVDVEGKGIPVALDTAGNVERSFYADNHFADVNGQCIDLDGFHDGDVTGNSCVNRKPIDAYPNLHEGIVFGNTNPGMNSMNVLVSRNRIEGFAYGGLYLIGSGERILDNDFLDINRAHCTGDMSRPRCNYAPNEPGLLRSGIYLGKSGGRPADTHENVIRNNLINGFGMDKWCIEAAPGVDLSRNVIELNRCQSPQPALGPTARKK